MNRNATGHRDTPDGNRAGGWEKKSEWPDWRAGLVRFDDSIYNVNYAIFD